MTRHMTVQMTPSETLVLDPVSEDTHLTILTPDGVRVLTIPPSFHQVMVTIDRETHQPFVLPLGVQPRNQELPHQSMIGFFTVKVGGDHTHAT